jgi:hypothetical protein
MVGLALLVSCSGELAGNDDGPSECIGGEFCVGDLVCVDGYCVPPVRCWGYNSQGRLGIGSSVSTSADWDSMPPAPISVF